ncbi:MAG TPA: tyrosine-type recombinase/integrase [Blastocatellia bacterium]|nr:tyrosine-type recombinase/integrase [Blastocatellia bacterium]
MARESYQKGRVEQRSRKTGVVYVLRYRLRKGDGWVEKTEELKGCRNDKEAQKAADKRMVEINRMNNGAGGITVQSFVQTHWAAYVANFGYKPSTAYNHQKLIDRYILPLLGDKDLTRIKPGDISEFFKQARKDGKARVNLYSLLRLMFGIAEEFDLIEVSPVRPKLHRPVVEKREKPTLTVEEIKRLIACIEVEYQLLVICGATMGLRIGELQALRWQDVDFANRLLTINHTLWRKRLLEPKTRSSRRTMRIPEPLVELLAMQQNRSRWSGPDDFVFARDDGGPLDASNLRVFHLYPAMDRAGIARQKFTHGFHIFRHSAATMAYALTKDLRAAQDLLRHASLNVTADIYVHTGENRSSEVAEALSRVIVAETVAGGGGRVQ